MTPSFYPDTSEHQPTILSFFGMDSDPATAVLNRFGHSKENTYAHLSEKTGVASSTIWHRNHGRDSIQQKAINQQYLSFQEEKALADHFVRSARNGFPLPVGFAGLLAHVIAVARLSLWVARGAEDEEIKPPGKNWPHAFYKRHPEIKAMTQKAIDWQRHDHHIYDKIVQWFTTIGQELANPFILPDNTYNMDETGVLLALLKALKVLVSSEEISQYRGAAKKTELITVIECISAVGMALLPMVIWPASTHRSNWTTHPTPGWHYGHSDSGYTDTFLSLEWIKRVFDPQTKARAGNNCRLLISDGFGTHESAELQRYCYENHIILARLASHTSHKCQPCDVGPFGPLKTYYREEVERLYRGGADHIGKPHFTLLYDRARRRAFTRRNIMSGWKKTGLNPWNPDIVLNSITRPQAKEKSSQPKSKEGEERCQLEIPQHQIQTPKTSNNLVVIRKELETHVVKGGVLNTAVKLRIDKIANAAENAFADRALLLDDNQLLFEQNCERNKRKSTKSTIVGTARVMGYDDLLEAELQRDKVVAEGNAKRGRKKSKPNQQTPAQVLGKRSRSVELKEATNDILALGLQEYCSVLSFN